MSYNENSDDAIFSRILNRLEQQAKETADFRRDLLTILNEVKVEVKATNGRVQSLERWRDIITAKVAVISAVTSFIIGGITWALNHIF